MQTQSNTLLLYNWKFFLFFLWNTKFSQRLWRDNRDNQVRVENFIKVTYAIFALDPSLLTGAFYHDNFLVDT